MEDVNLMKKLFKLGSSVRFKNGQKDEDLGIDISGWQGRIIEIRAEDQFLLVAFDSVTLNKMPREYLEMCEEEGLGWSEYYIGFDDVEPGKPRDRKKDVEDTITDLANSLGWAYLGEEGREINAILAGADDNYEQMAAWVEYLENSLTFPFKAYVSEWQEGPSWLRVGDRVRVIGIEAIDDLYGVLVKAKRKYSTFVFPLCDLKVEDEKSPNHDPVQLHAVWYANR